MRALLPLLFIAATTAPAQQAPALDAATTAANRELDRRLLDAHERKDVAMVGSTFSDSPDVFFIAPGGVLNKGKAAILRSFRIFFDGLESIHPEIKSLTYIPSGDGVIGLGVVVYHRKPKNKPADDRTVIWTDFRRKENGKWVYLFRHAHWPVEANHMTFSK